MARQFAWFPTRGSAPLKTEILLGPRQGVDYEALAYEVDNYQHDLTVSSTASWGDLALELLHMRGQIEEMLEMIHTENKHQVDGELLSPRRARDWMEAFCEELLNDKVDD